MNIEDIARKSGVSRSTVSRVLNGEPYVNEKTRARVLEVIAAEGYSPNPAARALATQRTQIVGVVIPREFDVVFEDPHYFPTLLNGVSGEVDQRDYTMLVWMGQKHMETERFYQRIAKNRLMDGVIIASASRDEPLILHLAQGKTHFVMVERPGIMTDEVSYVTVDNVRGGQVAVAHLAQRGRRRIGTVTGLLNNPDAHDRLIGYRQALEAAGLPFDPQLVVEGQFHRKMAYGAAQTLIERGVDAIFAANDTMALGVLDALRDAGRRVPADVAVVGFDDLPAALYANPPLTTMHQPIQYKGQIAAQLLLDLIEGHASSPQHIVLETTLVVRESSG